MKKLLSLLVSLSLSSNETSDKATEGVSLESANKEKQQIRPSARYLVMSAALIGCDSIDTYKQMLPKAVTE